MAEKNVNRHNTDNNDETSRLQLSQEMRQQNFDSIRFASYRTACKLRFIQKKVYLHNVDIWNVIEAFRENGLNTLESSYMLSVSRLETLLSSLFHALNKRVPINQQCKVDATTALLMNWLLVTYMSGESNKVTVFSIKVALATLCAGKLIDKFRYIYSQISDSNGHMMHWKFTEYLKEILSLPAAVYETPSFPYSEDLSTSIFKPDSKVTVNTFLDTFMSDAGPHCLIWLPLYHRIANVESVFHPIMCDACHKSNFSGFRYRCQKCISYQLCQDCFWRGKVSGGHTNDHETREYSSFKSPSKQIGHSLRKSFRCVPEKEKNSLPRYPEQPEKTLDLSHIVPPSPLPSHNGFQDAGFSIGLDTASMDSQLTLKSFDSSRLDDEHKLIAKYAHRLAQEARTVNHQTSPQSTPNSSPRSTKSPPLPQGGMTNSKSAPSTPGNSLVTSQQDSQQAEFLISSPNFQNPPSNSNLPLNIILGVHNGTPDNLTCVGGDVRSAFRTNSLPNSGSSSANNTLGRSLRNDLLVAADSVTNAMSTLVRELNSDSSSEETPNNSSHCITQENSDVEAGTIGKDKNEEMNFRRDDLQQRYQQENIPLENLLIRNTKALQNSKGSRSHEQTQNAEEFRKVNKIIKPQEALN
ncbi:dystrobrevin alpha isoform X5 [Microplitis mediator]|uniref:dystrobrevin alpha isoform X5 n=1 Tax=Microplitis mediator TaxID=375433 RepID=UPI002552F17F|nr:dystrobrevin alpha isoform X5 [Microplitis mediator]